MGGTSYSSTDVSLKEFSGEKNLEIQLTERIARSRKQGRRNYLASYTCYAVAIAASLLTTIALAAGLEDLSKTALVILTAIPGTILLVNSVFSLDKRATWHYKRARHCNGVLMRLRFEGLGLAAASEDIRKFDDAMEAEYPKFGMMPQPQSQSEKLS
jgi:hypothetical protein